MLLKITISCVKHVIGEGKEKQWDYEFREGSSNDQDDMRGVAGPVVRTVDLAEREREL